MKIAKACTRCKESKPLDQFHKRANSTDGHQYRCKACMREVLADWRDANREHFNEQAKEYARDNPLKTWARNVLNNAVRDQMIFREPCEKCGSEVDIQAHHPDYNEPLNVVWLCRTHHQEVGYQD